MKKNWQQKLFPLEKTFSSQKFWINIFWGVKSGPAFFLNFGFGSYFSQGSDPEPYSFFSGVRYCPICSEGRVQVFPDIESGIHILLRGQIGIHISLSGRICIYIIFNCPFKVGSGPGAFLKSRSVSTFNLKRLHPDPHCSKGSDPDSEL